MAEALYTRDILRLATSIPHLCRLDKPQSASTRVSRICGSRVTVELDLDEQGRVSRFGQEVKACALGQASAALLGASVIGRSAVDLAEARDRLADYLAMRRDDPGPWPLLHLLGPARPFPTRHQAILLPFEASAEAAQRACACSGPST